MQIRYVNTASTAGGNGTTNNTSGATRAFAGLAEAMDAMPGTLTDAYTVFCQGSAADTTSVNQVHLDFITSPTNYVLITTTAANRHQGPPFDTSKYRIEVTDTDGIYNNNPSHIRLDGLQVQVTVSTSIGNDYNCFRLATANNSSADVDHRISDCLANVVVSGGATDNVYGFIDSDPAPMTGTCRRWNCVALGGYQGFGGFSSAWGINNLTNYNCTAYGNEFPYDEPQKCINCIGAGATGGGGVFLGGVGTFGHMNNASDDATAGGTNSRINCTFTFVNAAGRNVHLQTSDVGAKWGGRIKPAGELFTDDIDSVERVGLWDIGADQQSTINGYPAINAVNQAYAKFPKNFVFRARR